ncbi:Sucrose-phosphate synthase [Thalictrum thalictroides]|uniref:Sucrose-phosphate synthase n=1 Tax=Thalictrum thalictroides TaxID=46969 RepID=A0A7J6WYH7_THATH|nr:Sucrose-phosphate synthase [Thalictrum thalictroides]
MLRRRPRLIVVAVDCYNNEGNPDSKMLPIVQEIIKAGRIDSQTARFSGFALLTAMPLYDTVEFLKSGQVQITEFDALVCSSGSEVYYPGTSTEDGGSLQILTTPPILTIDGDVKASRRLSGN